MFQRDIYLNISPIDHRYFIANKKTFEKLATHISEKAGIKYNTRVEIALLKALILLKDETLENDSEFQKLDSIVDKISPDEVYKEEEKTHHNIRALVNIIRRYVPDKWKPYVHLGATSVDILDTATALAYKDATNKVILPLLIELEETLVEITEIESATPQIGRTHGQHAVPITFGFAISEYVSRLGKAILRIKEKANDLRGKLAGAVGAYNATSLIVDNPEKLEIMVLNQLGINPSETSTQLVEPEYLLSLLLEMNVAFGIIANLADDLRNLQRSEIDEVREGFVKTQVGSSTMPQKRNPWNSEHVKSLWKTFSPRVITFFMDQISEHQRDLTNSASKRFIADYFAGFSAATARMTKVLKSLSVNREQMLKNIMKNGDMVLAEAVYILLSESGIDNAHEVVKQLTLKREKTNKTLWQIIESDQKLDNTLRYGIERYTRLNPEEFWNHPEKYTGLSTERAKKIAKKYRKIINNLKGELKIGN